MPSDSRRAARMNIVVAGAGPAGMSCALWLKNFGYRPIVLDRADAPGGIQKDNFHNNPWVLGFEEGSGADIMRHLVRHFSGLGIDTVVGASIEHVTKHNGGFLLRAQSAGKHVALQSRCLVVATGTQPRLPHTLANAARTSARVLVGPLATEIRDHIAGKSVLVLGGGDNALENSLHLARRDNQITICARAGIRGRKFFLDHCLAHPNIRVLQACQLKSVADDGSRVVAQTSQGQAHFDYVLVMFGFEPNSAWLEAIDPAIRPRLNSSGFIDVDLWQRTSVAGIYAAGDVTNLQHPCVATAIAQGAVAAKAIDEFLEMAGSD